MTVNRIFSEIEPAKLEKSSLIGKISQKIRTNLTEAEVLKIGVESLSEALECDRVVVYHLEPESRGKIVAESVNPNFPATLGTVIEDPCFEYRYLGKYQQGRVRAIANIHEAGMTPCYIENLEKIAVKAHLVVPILLPGNSLYGLLVAHQCSQPRQWKLSEIELTSQIASEISWALENARRWQQQEELQAQWQKSQQWQQYLLEIIKSIHSTCNRTEVLQIVVARVREIFKCDRVVVYCLQKPDRGTIAAESTVAALAPLLGKTIKDPCFEYRYLDQYQQGRVKAIANIYEAGMTPCYIENLEKIAVKAILVVPINWEDEQIYGLLVAHQCFQFREWQAEEIEWLKQVGIQTGLALSKAKLKEQVESINSILNSLKNPKNELAIAQVKVQQLQRSVRDTTDISVEINNLFKMLNREVTLINQASLIQDEKKNRLIQIIFRKISQNTQKIKDNLQVFASQTEQIKNILERLNINSQI
jgi:methyl-accepting chemotaxis protein PixJ